MDNFEDELREDYEHDLDAMYKEIGLQVPPRDSTEVEGIGGDEYVLTLKGFTRVSTLAEYSTITLYTGKKWSRFTITPIEAKTFAYIKTTSGMKMHVGTGQKFMETDGLVIKSKYLSAGGMLSQVFKRPETPQDLNKLSREGQKGMIMANHYNNMRTIELGTGEIVPALRTGLTIPMVVAVMMVNQPLTLYKLTSEDGEQSSVLVNGFVLITGVQ